MTLSCTAPVWARLPRALCALLLTALATTAAPLPTASAAQASPAQAPATQAPASPPRLTDGLGRVLQLRGLNLGKDDTVTPARLAQVARSGFDLVRLDIQWSKVEPAPGDFDTGYLRYLDRVLGWADRDRLRVLVDWHQDVFGPAFGFDGAPAWATRTDGLPFAPDPSGNWFDDYFQPAVQAAFRHLYDDADLRAAQAAAYTRVAETLRGHRSLLGYDLFNEPFGPVPDPADLPAASAALERGRLAAMYRRLIGAVRTADPDAWLFVEPTVLVGQGVPTQLPGFRDPRPGAPRIGYAPHAYDTSVEDGADWNPEDGFVTAYENAIRAYPAAHRMPLLVGEWGPPQAVTPGNAELVRRQVASMAGFATGWAMWYDCATPDGGGYCAYAPDGTPAPGKAPAFAPYARAVAGTPVAESYDPGTATYTLTLTANAVSRRAPTVLSTPTTAWPTTPRVTVSGAPHADVRSGNGRALITLRGVRNGTRVTVTVRPRGTR
ncbi:cellulase family glycosylhydrolase [Streptantibioticus parmotrematis]|uniref:glycoside hydrolase family 5 protein n=1 Tax=Streptantibioticus parmotrematis TaxID=2873249 RepID=UPI0034016FDF